MTANAPTLTKAFWVALILTACLQLNAFAADDSTTGGASRNPFGGTFDSPLSGFFSASSISGAASAISSSATSAATVGSTSLNSMADQYLQQFPEAKFLRDEDLRDANNNALPGIVNPALVPGASPFGTMFPPTPAAAMSFPTNSRLEAGMITAGLSQMGGFSGQQPSDYKTYLGQMVAGGFMARSLQYPVNAANQARAQTVGQTQAMTNAMGDMAKSQSASAIGYCSSYLQNFTTDESNRWNKIRNGLFVPVAILLLLPGAVLTQVRALAVAGNPVLSDPSKGDVNPFEGILRSVVAIFLIPGTYLVVNYGIDFSNSIVDSIASTYQTIMGSNMYQDALGTEVNAFPVRTPKQNQNAGAAKEWPQTAITNPKTYEQNVIQNLDPVTGQPIPGKTDEAMPAAAVAARQLSFGANAGLTAAWNILCAFQMAYLGYLFFVGPIAAALWVWPMTNLRAAFPNWVEGVITLCFWSLFWNTAILLMACFKGSEESTTMITTALNFLATASVKYAFDFGNLVKAAGQQAGAKAMEGGGSGGKSGGAGGKGGQGKAGSSNATAQNTAAQAGTNQPVGPMPGSTEQNPTVQPGALPAPLQPTFATGVSNAGLAPAAPTETVTAASYFTEPQLPPPAIAPGNAIRSENTSLGNFTVSRSFDPQGQPVDVLRANGQDIGQLPADISQPATLNYQGQELSIARVNSAEGTQFTLTNNADSTHPFTALMPPSDTLQPAANLGGTLSGSGNMTEDSIALRSNAGTLLLEDGGNTVLLPCNNQNGYDSFTLQPGATEGNFDLGQGRTLSISENPNRERAVALLSPNNQSESFTIRMTGDGAYNVGHAINGQLADNNFVSTDGQSTYYARYDAAGQLTDMDQITGNQINSSLYGDDNSLLGSVNTTYETNGNSESLYYQPDGSLTASTTHMFKPEGGFVDTVKNSQGAVVSVQEVGTGSAAGALYAPSSNYGQTASVYAPMSNYESTSGATQEYTSSASNTHNYSEDASQYVTESTAPMATQAAALLHRDAQSAITQESTASAPSPAVTPVYAPPPAPTRLRDLADSHSIAAANTLSSNMRSFRTISAILAATVPANAALRSVEQTERTAPALAPATRESANQLACEQQSNNAASTPVQDQYSTNVPAVLARIQNSANVNSVLIRNQNNESAQPELRGDQSSSAGASNYQILNSLLSLGQIQQARLILPIIQRDLATQNCSNNTNHMVNAYVQLLKQYSMNDEARFIQSAIAPQTVA
ncbi:hypothetical protein BH10CYA1_BH10CYA1_34600 [soil metagenome]